MNIVPVSQEVQYKYYYRLAQCPFINIIEIMNSFFSHIVKYPLIGISREHMYCSL